MLTLSVSLFRLLQTKEKRFFVGITVLGLFVAMLETLGVASIMPFIWVMSDVEWAFNHEFGELLSRQFDLESETAFRNFVGALVLGSLVVSLAARLLMQFALHHFSRACEVSLSALVFASYFDKGFEFIDSQNKSKLLKDVTIEIETLVHLGFLSLSNLISQSAIVLFLLVLLTIVNGFESLVVGVVVFGFYVVFYRIIKKQVQSLSRTRFQYAQERHKVASESFLNIAVFFNPDVRYWYERSFKDSSEKFLSAKVRAVILGLTPKYVIEALGFVFLVVFTFISVMNKNFDESLGLIALVAFAAYRMLPALQACYGSILNLKMVVPVLDSVKLLLTDVRDLGVRGRKLSKCGESGFKTNITSLELSGIDFSYSKEDGGNIFSDFSYKFNAGSSYGIYGPSGSGKTTLLKILTGLISPNSGELFVNGCSIPRGSRNLYDYWMRLGYCPQNSYVIDGSVKRNIILVGDRAENRKLMERICDIVDLSPETLGRPDLNLLDIELGDGGVLLSGGQRQRIGLARAIYPKPEVLVLDESTSALDSISENKIIKKILSNFSSSIIILVSHNKELIKKCDYQIDLSEKK